MIFCLFLEVGLLDSEVADSEAISLKVLLEFLINSLNVLEW